MNIKQEKRGHMRVDFFLETYYKTVDGQQFACMLKDISMSGFYILSNNPQPTGTQVELIINLNSGQDKQAVNAKCAVIRMIKEKEKSVKTGMALHIHQIDPDSSIVLYNMIKYQNALNVEAGVKDGH